MIGSITRLAIAGLLVAAPAIAQPAPAAATTDAPMTLQAVLEQARLNSQQFRAAQLTSDLAVEDKKQAKAALLPSVSGFTQYIYTHSMIPGEVQKFTLDGKLVGQFGTAGRKPGQFGWIHALSCVSENELWTGELLNWRVQKFTLHPERARPTGSR